MEQNYIDGFDKFKTLRQKSLNSLSIDIEVLIYKSLCEISFLISVNLVATTKKYLILKEVDS